MKTYKSLLIAGILSTCLPAMSGRAALTMEVLVSLDGTNGMYPGTLVQSTDGTLYGTAGRGGIGFNGPSSGWGTVFRIAPDGSISNLVLFDGSNGGGPFLLMQTTDGNFYGASPSSGCGIFKLAPDGTLINYDLASFAPFNGPAWMLEGPGGNLYGVAQYSGAHNQGRVFKIDTNGIVSTLASLEVTNGFGPMILVLHTNGNFYGIAQIGGDLNNGTVFKMSPDGVMSTLLRFQGYNGSRPIWLLQASDGNLYGTTASGGLGYGSVFKVSIDGTLLWSFPFNGTNGSTAIFLMQGADGNFYGTTAFGGMGFNGSTISGNGTIFKISPDGNFTSLLLLDGTNGIAPKYMITGKDGRLYGTADRGGPTGPPSYNTYGTVFRLSIPMAPSFMKTEQTNDQFTLTWSAVAGQLYQLQYNSDLSSTNWINLGSSIVATNGTMSASDSFGSDAQRFYRVALLP